MRVKVKRGRWLFAIVNLALVLLCLAAVLAFFRIAGTLQTVRGAERWRGENEMLFSQVACFLREDEAIDEEAVFAFRRTLDETMTENLVEAPEGGSLWVDGYSAQGSLTVSGVHGTATVHAIGVGGSFFQFHPLSLRSGSYISENDLMQDRVVLDEETAWQVFGGANVAGLEVTIGGKPYYVAGVVSREQDFATKAAYSDGAGIYMSYSALHELTEAGITCYEVILPDLISGYGYNLVKDKFSVGRGDIVENSARYSLKNLLAVVKDFGTRSMRSNGVIYPYWENAVRYTEDWLALLLVLAVLFGLCPAVTLIVLAIVFIVRGCRFVTGYVPKRLDAAAEKKKEKNYAKVGE